jgi:small subunit ribosomal protein S8
MTDPLADMLSRIRNGQQARLAYVNVPFSKLKQGVLDVLKREGYIESYAEEKDAKSPQKRDLKVTLKYVQGKPSIEKIIRVSKPGLREYTDIATLPPVYNGLGISILTTSRGIFSDQEAREQNVGGEVLCKVF